MKPFPSRGPAGSDGAAGATGPAGSAGAVGPAPSGSAGDQVRLVSTGVAGATSPDLVCLVAELATTYAPSAVLRGVVAYATDTGDTYVCRRTGVSTCAWRMIDVAPYAAVDSACRVSLEFSDLTGAATIANNGAAGGTLTKAGSPTIATYPVLGGRGLICPTSSDYYAGLDAEVLGSAYTLEAWISGGTGSGTQTVCARRVDATGFVAPYTAGALLLSGTSFRTFTGTTTNYYATTAGSVPTTGIHHVCSTWSAATSLLLGYVDGELVSTTATAGTMIPNTSGRWGIGQLPQGNGASNEPFSGIIYMARAHNAVLTPAQIQERWARGVRMYRA